jgi:signal transduction histidine kinase
MGLDWQLLRGVGQFLRTPTLSRAVVGLLTLAIILLLAVNIATFVMIRRTAEFNETVDQNQNIRLVAKDVLTLLVDAETGQRGFILTASPTFLTIHEEALQRLPAEMDRLGELVGDDPELRGHYERVRDLAEQRRVLMIETINRAREGRIGEAVQLIRSGPGKGLMDGMRAEIAAIDEIETRRLMVHTGQSEWAAAATAMITAMAALLIIILAGISGWLISRYVGEIRNAHMELDRLNAGLENEVRDRTAQLTRANEEIQRFAYIVSHDLRAPLVNVMGYTSELEQAGKTLEHQIARLETASPDLIEKDAVLAVREDVPEAIGFIRASTAKMDRLINAILKLSREGRRPLVAEKLDMKALAQQLADSVRHQTDAADAEIIVGDLPSLESDRFSIEQIFGNLVDNAVKYLDPGRPGRILIEGEQLPGGWVHYRVIDNGRGVSDRDHERVFELFRRSGRQDRPGEGLGLAFVRNSVRRLGGSIDIESELGKGSTFHLKFPRRLVVGDTGGPL